MSNRVDRLKVSERFNVSAGVERTDESIYIYINISRIDASIDQINWCLVVWTNSQKASW